MGGSLDSGKEDGLLYSGKMEWEKMKTGDLTQRAPRTSTEKRKEEER
jgi:hypothetical protein